MSQETRWMLAAANHESAHYVMPFVHNTNPKGELVALPRADKSRIILVAKEDQYPPSVVISHQYAHHLFLQASRPKPAVSNGETYAAQESLKLWTLHYVEEAVQAEADLKKAKNEGEETKAYSRFARAGVEYRIIGMKSALLSVVDEGEVALFQIENYDNQKISEQAAYFLILGIYDKAIRYAGTLPKYANLDAPSNREISALVRSIGPEGQQMEKRLIDAMQDATSRAGKISELLSAPKSKAVQVRKKISGK